MGTNGELPAVLLTFIYTRCPLPNFCPLMSKNFSELEHRLGAKFTNRFKLLSVSIDPEFDTPEVLKAYASRYEAWPGDWTFACGNADQIKFVADLMGLYYARENGLISHDVRTALIRAGWPPGAPVEEQRLDALRGATACARDTDRGERFRGQVTMEQPFLRGDVLCRSPG